MIQIKFASHDETLCSWRKFSFSIVPYSMDGMEKWKTKGIRKITANNIINVCDKCMYCILYHEVKLLKWLMVYKGKVRARHSWRAVIQSLIWSASRQCARDKRTRAQPCSCQRRDDWMNGSLLQFGQRQIGENFQDTARTYHSVTERRYREKGSLTIRL